MRVIFNIPSKNISSAAGWRAREIHVNAEKETDLDKVLKAVILTDGSSLFDVLIKNNVVADEWILFVNGLRVIDLSVYERKVMDSVQIHVMDKRKVR